jgi:murein tripeptide amidase MpaA
VLLPVINVAGRQLVEVVLTVHSAVLFHSNDELLCEQSGEYCVRTNARGVDLNRNYDDHWQATYTDSEEYPGWLHLFSPAPYSFFSHSVHCDCIGAKRCDCI